MPPHGYCRLAARPSAADAQACSAYTFDYESPTTPATFDAANGDYLAQFERR
jgi:hypothetical protein